MENDVITILEPIIGEYTPDEYTVTYNRNEIVVVADSSGVETAQTVAYTDTETVIIPDYNWFASTVIFIVFVYSILRMIGGLLKWKI